MPTRVSKTVRFEAAHHLPTFPDGHKCKRLHGHSFEVDLVLEGEIDPALGVLIDFGDIKRAAAPLVEQLDHRLLNEIPGLEVPTAENLARWIYDRLKNPLPHLVLVRVHESRDSFAEYHQ